jgi:hypothetical protein
MASIVWPYDDPFVYNRLILGPYVIPGRAECHGVTAKRAIDVKKPKGKSGGTITDNGCEHTKVKFLIHQWKREHHAEWQRVFPMISPRREGATKEPFEALNAYLWEQDIRNVLVSMILPKPYDTKGKRIIEIELEEWLPETKTVKAGTGKPKEASTLKTPLGNQVGTWKDGVFVASSGFNPLVPANKNIADPSDPNEIMRNLLGQ